MKRNRKRPKIIIQKFCKTLFKKITKSDNSIEIFRKKKIMKKGFRDFTVITS